MIRRIRAWGPAALSMVMLHAGAANAQDEGETVQVRQPQWYDGFSITPGLGLRHFALHVERRADGDYGSLSNSIESSFFYALDVQSPTLQLTERWGLGLYAYTANVRLSEQFTDDDSDGDSNTGSTVDVGTGAKGRYSYVVPAVHYQVPLGSGHGRVALGYGTWAADVSGDIILTPDNRPARGMPTTDFDVHVRKRAYLFLMQWRGESNWQWSMSVGGPKWSEGGHEYEIEEVSLVLGYSITPQTFGAP